MQQALRERLEAQYHKRALRANKLSLPSWWRKLAPGKGPRFWNMVDAMRQEAQISRSDMSAMAFLIDSATQPRRMK